MNPNAEPPPPQQLAPPQPPQPHRLSTSCDKHPEEQFTGFCPSCLCERLAVLEPSSSSASSSKKPPILITTSTATAALKAIFKGGGPGNNNSSGRAKPGFFPELRRTKSFSASKNEGFSGVFEPQRRSCDVRNTLWTLFSQENERNPLKEARGEEIVEVESRNLGESSGFRGPVLEGKEEGETEYESEQEDDFEIVEEELNAASSSLIEEEIGEIVEEQQPEPELVQKEEVKLMKDHIDLDSQTKKRDSKIAGSFWSAASVFSKKLQKWRQKQKLKKRRTGGGSARLPVEKPIGRQYRETQSEIADYGFGRRSCDTDPRFSLDAGRMSLDAARMSFDAARMSLDAARMSFDDPRYSLDEPRASWDGHLISRTTFPRMPSMLSVVEDAPAPVHVLRSDTQIPVEEPMNCINEEETVPGGSAQTRDYYSSDSSRSRRKSLDRSSSIRKTAEMDEMKPVSNSKVSPATVDCSNGPKLVVQDRDLRDFSSNSLRDDYSETFEIGVRDNAASVIENGDRKAASKKSRSWIKGWSILGFIYRRGVNKYEEEDRFSRVNGVGRSFSESWPEFRGERNVPFNPKVMRSNSSVSWRNSGNFGGGGGARKNGVESLERNRSARYSPNDIDNGLLRFYLNPMRGSRRVGPAKERVNQAQSIARNMLRLY